MYRDNLQLVTEPMLNFVLNHGALGDTITSLPAIIAARRHYPTPDVTLRVWAGEWQHELLRHLLAPYGEFEVHDFEKFPKKAVERQDWDGGAVALNSAPFNVHTRNRVHMVDFAFAFMLDSRPENMPERSYPTAAPLGPRPHEAPYVVFPTGATSANKLFRASVMAPVIRWVVSHGYTPVLLGTAKSHVMLDKGGELAPVELRDEVALLPEAVRAKCLDMRHKTTLLEARDWCGHAAAVVGVDGGTIHLAGTTDAPIIYALTTTHPRHRYIPRHGDHQYRIRYVVPTNLECAGCQSNWRAMAHHSFTDCLYNDNLCTERLDPEGFIQGLVELGL